MGKMKNANPATVNAVRGSDCTPGHPLNLFPPSWSSSLRLVGLVLESCHKQARAVGQDRHEQPPTRLAKGAEKCHTEK